MKDKILAFIIMLSAGTVIAFACIFSKIELVPSLLYIAGTLLIFYIIGLIINGIITKINKEAEARAKMLAKKQKEEQEAAAERQEEEEEKARRGAAKEAEGNEEQEDFEAAEEK